MPYRVILSCILITSIVLNTRAQEVTYIHDVAPIMTKHCVSCHKKGGNAPFGLEDYKQVKNHAKMVASVTLAKYMPPWKANPQFSHFANERILSTSEINTIQQWVDQGCIEGLGQHISQLPIKKDKKPDLILKMPTPIEFTGDNQQHFFCYKIPFEIPQNKSVKAIEFVAGNKKLVHHASYQILEVSNSAPIHSPPYFFEYNTQIEHLDNISDFQKLHLIGSDGKMPELIFHTGWLPGVGKHIFPTGIGFTMPQKGVLLMRNLHYSATPIPQKDQSEVHIYFTDKPITRKLEFAAFKPKNVHSVIPKDSVVTYKLKIRTSGDMSLLAINPHMHKLATYFKAYAITPQKDTIRLIEIPNWDFNWQEFYRYQPMLKIPSGSFLNAEAIYNNTSRNMNNPNNPPQDVYFEKGNMDDDKEEMMRLVFMFLPYQQGDEKIVDIE